MAFAIGVAVALGVAVFGSLVHFGERTFWSVVLTVTASYYLLFAVIGNSLPALTYEVAAFVLFVGLAVVGFRISLWFVVAGLVAHGLFDVVRGGLIANAGVPAWWPGFCLGFDVAAAAWIAWRLLRPDGSDPRPA